MQSIDNKDLRQLFDQISSGESVEEITAALNSGLDVNAEIQVQDDQGIYGLRAITVAAQSDRMEIVELLLERGAEASCSVNDDGIGDAPINAATRNGNLQMVQTFIDLGVDLDTLCDIEGSLFTPLQIVSSCHDYKYNPAIIQALVKGGANITNQDTIGRTILNYVVEENDLATTKVILDQLSEMEEGIKSQIINAFDQGGESSFHTAILAGNSVVVELFLDNGADIELGTADVNESFTPIYIASRESYDVTNLLLDRGAQINLMADYEEHTIELIAMALQRESRFNDQSFLPHFNNEAVQNEISPEQKIFFIAAITNSGNELPTSLRNFAAQHRQEIKDLQQIKEIPGMENLTVARQNIVMASNLEMFAENRKFHTFLAIIMPEGELRDSVINRFNSNEINAGAPPLPQEKISKLREYKDNLVRSLIRSSIANKQDSIKMASDVIETLLVGDNLELAREYIIQERKLSRTSLSFAVKDGVQYLPVEISGMSIMPFLNDFPNPLKGYPEAAMDALRSLIIMGSLTVPQGPEAQAEEEITSDDWMEIGSMLASNEEDSTVQQGSVFLLGKRSLSQDEEEEKEENKKLKYSPTAVKVESLSPKQNKDRS